MPTSRPVPEAEQSLGAMTAAAHEHHSELWAELTLLETDLMRDVVADEGEYTQSRDAFAQFLRKEVTDHLDAEHTVLHSTARGVGEQALAQSLDLDHASMVQLINHLAHAQSGLEAALAARSLVLMFALRMEKEERVLLPLLRDAGVDVESLLEGKSSITGEGAHEGGAS